MKSGGRERREAGGMELRGTSLVSLTIIMSLAFTGLDGARFLQCDRTTFDYEIHNHCVPLFRKRMASSNYTQECPWPRTKGYYIQLDACMKKVVNRTFCVEPSLKNEIFLELHQTYFPLCGFMQDPGLQVLMLLMLPCILITFLMPFLCVHLTSSAAA